jgi:osmotically inducible protein OsmC
MAKFNRTAESVWRGDLRTGSGKISTSSKVLIDVDYRYETRFENEPGTNPEELIAAAHAACYNMALASTLKKKGHEARQLQTIATCTLASKEGGGFEITNMHLEVHGFISDLSESEFQEIAQEADQGCPVSNLLRPGVAIELEATLE